MKFIFNKVLAKSPFKPLKKHSLKVQKCCHMLLPFIKAVTANEWDKAAELRETIAILEREADNLKRDLRTHLPNSIFMAVSRSDLLDLVTQLDKLANYSKEIAYRIMVRKLEIPEELVDMLINLINISISGVDHAVNTIDRLDILLETGFKGREAKVISNMVSEMDLIEDQEAEMTDNVRKKLLAVESKYNPIDIVFLYKIIDRIGILCEQAQRVGSRIELMVVAK